MSLVMNENEWARDMILRRDLGNKKFETLTRVARYYLESGFSKREVRRLLDAFVVQCDPEASLPLYAEMLDSAIKSALKRKSVNIESIGVTAKELKEIAKSDQRQSRRLAFTLLVLAKYYDQFKPNNDHWVGTKDSDIMKMANISTSIKRQSAMYNHLNKLGLVQFSKQVDNISTRVTFVDDGDPVLVITDLRNLGYQYMKYCGEDLYFVCENCGITDKRRTVRGRNQKYCIDCATKIRTKQNVDAVMASYYNIR